MGWVQVAGHPVMRTVIVTAVAKGVSVRERRILADMSDGRTVLFCSSTTMLTTRLPDPYDMFR